MLLLRPFVLVLVLLVVQVASANPVTASAGSGAANIVRVRYGYFPEGTVLYGHV